MAGVLRLKNWLFETKAGSKIALLACLLWIACLPFAMAQQTRFTSIFLFSILGGFLIHCFSHGFDFYRVAISDFRRLLPMAFLALLPLLHFIPDGYNLRELTLQAPLFFIPWILMHFRSSWPGSFPKIAVAVLLLSFFFLCFLLFLQGPQTVWNSVRSEEEIPDLFILARPQMGFLAGILFFLTDQAFKLHRSRLMYSLSFAFTALVLLWILAKIALISFFLVLLLLQIWKLRRRPFIFAGITGFSVVCLLVAVLFVYKTGILVQAFSRGGLPFDQYPKAYVNSINSRLVLWQAGFQVLGEGNNLFSGVPSELLQPKLDAAVGSLNAYLESRHLNPHNQFLYLLLHYGIPGLIVFCLFWFGLFRMSAVSAPLAGLWIFAFCCSQTEIYLDREFGSQLYLLLLVLSIQIQPSKLPDSPAGNV